ncbi:MAG: hypothetical protein IT539_06510 [Bradyrhizobiaceae bacterium]|nr:hypothetical protein [Bradyrhizobiaceae bacterium]
MQFANQSSKVRDHLTYVVYDPTNGDILSVYHSVSYEGADPAPDQKELESRAITLSKQFFQKHSERSFDEKNVKALASRPELFEGPGAMKVDLKQLTVVPVQ